MVLILTVSRSIAAAESGTEFRHRYRLAPQMPVPIHVVQDRLNTIFDPDSRIDYNKYGYVAAHCCTVYVGLAQARPN